MRRPATFTDRMLRPLSSAALAALALAGAAPTAATIDASDPAAEAIFARAKATWRAEPSAPFVRYNLLERYAWRGKPHDEWWSCAFRASDGALVLHRTVTSTTDAPRLRGIPIRLNVDYHGAAEHADDLETNGSADAFPVLDPLIPPDEAFGLVPGAKASLANAPTLRATPLPERIASAPEAAPPTVAPTAIPDLGATGTPTDPPLREIVRVEAVARDYRIALAGNETIRDVAAYHLTLEPLRDPRRNRLRDLWVAVADGRTLRLAVDGLFAGKPYDSARWIVDYVDENGRPYVQQIKTTDTLRFGADRSVAGLEYDFVQYAFPATIAPWEFARLL